MGAIDHYCHSCYFWEWTGKTTLSGYCGVYSCRCADAIVNSHPTPPPRYLSLEEVNGKEE